MPAKQSINIELGKAPDKNVDLKEQLQFYEKIFSSVDAIVFIFDLHNYQMMWANEGFKKALGYKKATKNIGKEALLDIYHPEDRNVLEEMKAFFEENRNKTFTGIFKFRNIKGKYIWLCTVANVFRKTNSKSIFEIVGISFNFSNELTYNKNLKVITKEKLQVINKRTIEVLTKRELEMTRYFSNGYKTKEIADKLELSFHTVNNHRKNILKKLELKNLAALVNFAVENGLD